MAKQRKMTDEELKQWNELCYYVRHEILKYDESSGKKFPIDMILLLLPIFYSDFINLIASVNVFGSDAAIFFTSIPFLEK